MDLSALSDVVPRLLAMAALIVGSAFFSGSETALFSLSRGQRERLARSDRSNERYIAALLREPRRLIVTILVGNELINVTFSSLAAGLVERVATGWGHVAVIVATTGVTVPILLLFGEVTPKSIALRAAETWARIAARPLGLFAVVATPVRLVVNGVSGVVVRLFGAQPTPPPKTIGEAEFKALVDAGSAEGTLEDAERKLIHNVFEFGDRTIAEIMTPAARVFSLSYDLPMQRLLAEIARSGFSRVPIFRGKRHEIAGIVYAKDLVGWSGGRLQARTLKDLLKAPLYVPKTTKCAAAFQEFQRKKTHMAMVVDEYGRWVGLITMEDLLGELFGALAETPPESRPAEPREEPREETAS